MPTAARPIDDVATCSTAAPGELPGRWWAVGEFVALMLLFYGFAGQAPPQVNEAHYLAKARHFFDPTWCAGDLFLESADAHAMFYRGFGWVVQFVSLPTAAWIGRLLAWSALAWSWRRLSFAVIARPGWSVWTAAVWLTGLEYAHMAGEWVVGGVEAKCFAYAASFLAVEALTKGRWSAAWLWMGAATACHVLVGGWGLVGIGVAWAASGAARPPLLRQLAPLTGALGLALLGVVPALGLTAGQSAEIRAAADWIYVFDRLPHHLVFHRLPHVYIARHAALIGLWIACCAATPCRVEPGRPSQRPLRAIAGCGVLLAIVGATIDQALLSRPDWSAPLLRYYWFRMSDAWTPAALAFAAGGAIVTWRTARPRRAAGVFAIATFFAVVGWIDAGRRHGAAAGDAVDPTFQLLAADGRIKPERLEARMRDWRRVCEWARRSTPADNLFVTPRHQQTFKWYAERAEAVTIKDVPQDSASVVEWQRRRYDLGYALPWIGSGFPPDLEYLQRKAREWGADWVIVDRQFEPPLSGWERRFPVAGEPACLFEVYRVP